MEQNGSHHVKGHAKLCHEKVAEIGYIFLWSHFWILKDMRNYVRKPKKKTCANFGSKIQNLSLYFFEERFLALKSKFFFGGWFWTIVNSTQDSFLQLCQFSLIIIKLWNLMKKSIFWVRKKALLVILLLRPIYGGTLCILNESWCNVKIRFTCCMTAILIFRYHIRPPYIHSLHLSWTNMNRKKMEGKLN